MLVNRADREGYLQRLAAPLQEKLWASRFIPKHAKRLLDVGCADGALTVELAKMFPTMEFLGIDLDEGFIEAAQKMLSVPNLSFEKIYLRELLYQAVKPFDVIQFYSVIHEFYSYGQGTSSVIKALADAKELLQPGGLVFIRDLALDEYSKHSTLLLPSIQYKLYTRANERQMMEFLAMQSDKDSGNGMLSLHQANQFLVKYLYVDNWEVELRENRIPLSTEQYKQIFDLLDMQIQLIKSYTIPYMTQRWRDDFGLTEDELELLKSTTIIIAKKS